MDKVLGIIAEYNPFHNGHLYHIQQSKKITNCNYTICIMSGNFTQRGSCSLIDKWSKAKMAIENGIDLVIELPVLYAVSSAENFAFGSIKILDSLKIVNNICFGSECSDIKILQKLANILHNEPTKFKDLLSYELKQGISFPKARANAIVSYLDDSIDYSKILSSPNNILGIEYLKALLSLNSNITPHTIQRIDCDYNSMQFVSNIASSTAIRNLIKINKLDMINKLLPASSYDILIDNMKKQHIILDLNNFEKEIIFTLRKMSIQEISDLGDVTEGLEYSLKKTANSCNNITQFMHAIKSKRYTNTRIQRILIYSLLGIKKRHIQISKNINPYIRILGFNKNGKYLLSKISKANPELEIITSVKKFENHCINNDLKLMLEKDIYATNIYTLAYGSDSFGNLDYTQPIQSIDICNVKI